MIIPATEKQNNSLTRTIALFVIITAVEALGLSWVWNNAIAVPLSLGIFTFGHVFVILLAIKALIVEFKTMFHGTADELEDIHKTLKEIRDIQIFSEQNKSFQFSSVVALLNETIKERDAEKLAANDTPDK